MIVPCVRTPVPLEDLPDVLDAGHHRLRGFGLSPDAIAIAAAQLQLEHGVGSLAGAPCLAGVYGFNLGNHDASTEERADPAAPIFLTVLEREVGAAGDYRAQHLRRAYVDATAGAVGYWQTLLDTFTEAYDAMAAGDVDGFVHQLKVRKYFTAAERDYDRIEEQLVATWRARIAAAGAV